jgi:hypothetical protein
MSYTHVFHMPGDEEISIKKSSLDNAETTPRTLLFIGNITISLTEEQLQLLRDTINKYTNLNPCTNLNL